MRLEMSLLALAAGLAGGCLAGQHAYLRLSSDFRPPAEYADAATLPELEDAWLRHAPLGLEGHVAAILEDPVVGAAELAYEASRSRTPGRPGEAFRADWDELYRGGGRLPVRVRWRFDKHFHKEGTIDPTSGWRFELIDDGGKVLAPLEIGPMTPTRKAADWVGEFRLWFPRRTVDGRLLITSHTRSLTMTVHGVPGEASMTWRFLPLLEAADSGL